MAALDDFATTLPDAPEAPSRAPLPAWLTELSPRLQGAALRGLARVVQHHPALLLEMDLAWAHLPADATRGTGDGPDPAHRMYGKAPVAAMLARLGHAPGPDDDVESKRVLASAALFLFYWAAHEDRRNPVLRSAIEQACCAVRAWWEPDARKNDAFPRSLARLLEARPQINQESARVLREQVETLSQRGTARLDCLDRAIGYLHAESKRHPRPRVPRGPQADASPAVDAPRPSPPAGTTGTPETASSPAGQPDRTPAPAVNLQGVQVPGGQATHRRRTYQLADRAARESTALGILRDDPRAATRRARHALDLHLPLARLDELHATDWCFLRDWLEHACTRDAAIVLALVFSGQSPDALLNGRVYLDLAESTAEPDAVAIVLYPFGFVLPNRINPDLPKGTGDDPAVERLFLPLPDTIAGQDRDLLEPLRRACGSRVASALCEVDELAKLAHAFDSAAVAAGSAMRLGRLPRALERVMYNHTGSGLVWQYVRNRAPDAVYLPALHYARFDVADIAGHYQGACATLARRLGASLADPPPDGPPWPGTVGSRHCPTDAAVAALARQLAAPVVRPRGAPTVAKLIEFHNALTRYTLCMLLAATGARPTRAGLACLDPMPIARDGLPALLLRDKPQLDRTGRIVPVAPSALKQWRSYQRHCRWITQESLLAPRLSRDERHRARIGFPDLFLIADDFRVAAVTPQTCASALSPMKENALRHWILNALRRAGWREDRIALLAGHTGRLHGAGAAWSVAAPWRRAEVEDIERTLVEAGWMVRGGMGNG